MYLAKSDFIVARTCPTKLFYKKKRYPSLTDDDEYLRFLAAGGYMVEKMAKLLYPDGQQIGSWDKPEQAFAETQSAVTAGNTTLFEATVISGRLLARHDILQRFGKVLRLIEVKSSSINMDDENPFRGKRGEIIAAWLPYLEDITFQVVVLRRAFPDYQIIPHLCVVDKSKAATTNSTFDKFCLVRGEGTQGRFRPTVEYTGDAVALKADNVIAIIDVTDEVADLEAEVAAAADELAATISSSITRIAPLIGLKCKGCEYRLPADGAKPNGFQECWGKLAEPDPHILDLYRIDVVGGRNSETVAELAAEGKARLDDVPTNLLAGEFATRQRLQLQCTADNQEFVDPQLQRLLARNPYPLHFIDFEASRLAIPYHAGMHPYEIAAFQWSTHSVRTADSQLEHGEWLNDADAFPNFAFARSLKEQIGDTGTVYIWSPYEMVVLREIRRQMDDYGEKDLTLGAWLDRITAKGNSRIVDLCEQARRYYFHPMMRGSVSIKYVLPAVWEADAQLRGDPLFAEYVTTRRASCSTRTTHSRHCRSGRMKKSCGKAPGRCGCTKK